MNIREQILKFLRQSSESFTPSESNSIVERIASKYREKELCRIADIDIVRILGQGFSKGQSNVNREEVVQLLGDALNLLAYNNKKYSEYQQDSHSQRTYDDNKRFWEDALRQNLLEGMQIRLVNFHLMHWLPFAPGRYFTPEATRKRLEAQRQIIKKGRGREYLPLGKELMFLGGIGSVRLGARTFNSKTVYLLGASSTGSSHQGIPIIVPEEEYQKVIPLLQQGGCLANLEGFLRICPVTDLLIQYDTQIPRYVICIDNLQVIRPSERLLVTVGVTFGFENSHYDGYTKKSWSFCSFDPTTDDVRSSARWLEEYALRYSGRAEILSDFDEHYQHFGNYSVEFPVSRIVRGEVDRHRLNEYSRIYHFHINEGAIMTQYSNYGSVGAMGENARSDHNTFTQLEREKTLSEAAAEIQQLLNQLSATQYTSEADLVDALHQEIRRNPTLKARLVNALKAGGLEALKAIFNHPAFTIPAETVKGWLEAE